MSVLETYNNRPKKLWVRVLVFVILLVLVLWSADGITYKGIAAKGSEVAYGIVYGLTHPDLNLLFDTTTSGVFYLTAQTVAIAILGTIFGAILAIPFSFLASENIVPKWVAFIFREIGRASCRERV